MVKRKTDSTLNSIAVKYDLTFFEKGVGKPWHLVSAEYSRRVKKTVLLARFNYAERFGKNALQAEADAYPVLSKKVYAYLNVGFSPGKQLFPAFRSGASVYVSLPAAFELEAGARYLYFDEPIYVYTASVGKYYKKYWFNASGFLSPENSNISSSWFFKTRYYLTDLDYVMILLGSGFSPDNRIDNSLFNTYLKSTKAELSLRKTVKRYYTLLLSAAVSRQQIPGDAYINQFNMSTGLQVAF